MSITFIVDNAIDTEWVYAWHKHHNKRVSSVYVNKLTWNTQGRINLGTDGAAAPGPQLR